MSFCEDFYLVWNPNGRSPTQKHPTQAEARAEAERLARANSGHEFYVLAVVGMARKTDVEWLAPDEIPF